MSDLHDDLAQVLISEEEVRQRVRELAEQISADYSQGQEPLFVGILKGAFIFLSDLVRAIEVPHKVDFMALSSYGASATHTGEVRIIMDLREPVRGKHIVIVEDIVDTGQTLNYLYGVIESRGVASLKTCVLLRKQRESIEVPIDYLGFDLPDVWVVGYGLDFAERFRTLPYIAELKQGRY